MTARIESSSSRTATPENVSPAVAMGCIGMFMLPFAAGGLASAVTGLGHLTRGNWLEGIALMLFGLVFGGFAAAGVTAVIVGRRKLKQQEILRARNPDQPWMWRADWAAGRISDSSHGTMWAAWIFAILWNLIGGAIGFVGVRSVLVQRNPEGLAALFFPVVGVGLLVWAVRTTLRYRKYGMSRLELSTIPGCIGRSLVGTVRLNATIEPEHGFDLRLSCIRRVTTRSGKNSSTHESILWQEEMHAQGQSSRDASGMSTRIPVAFAVPADAQPSDASQPRDQIVWRLEVSASVPGVDYAASFEVPVFRTPESSLPPTELEARLVNAQTAAVADYKQPPESKIAVIRNRRGTEIVFPSARNAGVALGTTVFALLWGIMLAALVRYDAPVLFPVVFGLFELLLIVGTLQFWFGVSRVTADREAVTLAQGYFQPGRGRTIPATDVSDVTIQIGMQAGSTPYYDVVVVRKDGKRKAAGRWIRVKREAEWLASLLKEALELAPQPTSGSSLASRS